MAVYPLDTRQLSIPISRISSFLRSFAFHFHTIIIIINFELWNGEEIRELVNIIRG